MLNNPTEWDVEAEASPKPFGDSGTPSGVLGLGAVPRIFDPGLSSVIPPGSGGMGLRLTLRQRHEAEPRTLMAEPQRHEGASQKHEANPYRLGLLGTRLTSVCGW